jgi:hypothetical protein
MFGWWLVCLDGCWSVWIVGVVVSVFGWLLVCWGGWMDVGMVEKNNNGWKKSDFS